MNDLFYHFFVVMFVVFCVACFAAGFVAGRGHPIGRASLYDRLQWAELRHVPLEQVVKAREMTEETFTSDEYFATPDKYPRNWRSCDAVLDRLETFKEYLRTSKTVIIE